MKRTLALAMALMMVLGLYTIAPAMAEGTKLTYALTADPETMDPTLNSYSRASSVIKQLFVGLYKVAPDGETHEPALAESYKVSDDGLTYTFTLKKDLKWSDGSPLTALDFDYTWKRTLSPDLASKAAKDLFCIKNAREYNEGKVTVDQVGIKAPDEQTLVVDVVAPTPWFITLLSGSGFMPVQKALVETGTKDVPWTNDPSKYVSNGPFMLKDYKLKERLEMVKNPNYFDAASVKLDAIDMVIVPDAAAELVAYQTGEIDVADDLNAEAIGQFKSTPEYHAISRIRLDYFDFNCKKAPFDNKLVRQAFSMSIDRKLILENVLKAADLPLYGFIPQRQPSIADPTKGYRDVVPDTFAYDVDKAKALLAEAGYTDISTFPEVELIYSAGATNDLWCQALQAMWKQNLGVNVKLTHYESGVFWDEMDAGHFDIGKNGFTVNYADPYANLELFAEGFNAYENGWQNSDYDKMVADLRMELDPAKREAKIIEAEKFLTDEMPAMPFDGGVDDFLAKPYVQGIIKSSGGHILFEYVTIAK